MAFGTLVASTLTLYGADKIARSEAAKIGATMTDNINAVATQDLSNLKMVHNRVTSLAKVDDRQDIQILLNAGAGQLAVQSSNLKDLVGHIFSQSNSWSLFDPTTEDIS